MTTTAIEADTERLAYPLRRTRPVCENRCCWGIEDTTIRWTSANEWCVAGVDFIRPMYSILPDDYCYACTYDEPHPYNVGMRWNADVPSMVERHAAKVEQQIFRLLRNTT